MNRVGRREIRLVLIGTMESGRLGIDKHFSAVDECLERGWIGALTGVVVTRLPRAAVIVCASTRTFWKPTMLRSGPTITPAGFSIPKARPEAPSGS